MKMPPMKAFRVRRAAREAGKPDTLQELEWLGGEALVAPLPYYADRPRIAAVAAQARCSDAACSEWIAL